MSGLDYDSLNVFLAAGTLLIAVGLAQAGDPLLAAIGVVIATANVVVAVR